MMTYEFFFFNDTATTEIYTLSLHDALPIFHWRGAAINTMILAGLVISVGVVVDDAIIDIENIVRRLRQHRQEGGARSRSEEHTSELQSRQYLVCRLLL